MLSILFGPMVSFSLLVFDIFRLMVITVFGEFGILDSAFYSNGTKLSSIHGIVSEYFQIGRHLIWSKYHFGMLYIGFWILNQFYSSDKT